MTGLLQRFSTALLALLACVVLVGLAYSTGKTKGFAAGVEQGQAPLLRDLAALREQHAARERQAAAAQAERLAKAQAKGEELQLELLRLERLNRQHVKERQDGLATETFGVPCLGSGALRLLDGAPGLRIAALPTAASAASGADGATTPAASDRDVASWALAAGEQHERCRARLDALRRWHEEQAPAPLIESQKGPVP